MSKQRYPMFAPLCVSMGLPKPVAEHKFHPERRWRFDFAWPEYKLAVEIEGGDWINGGHNRGSGRIKDREKFNAATVLGWRVLHFTPKEIMASAAIGIIGQCFYAQHK